MHEATAYPGGRCRSYLDRTIGMTIDNGNHLVLSGNHAVLDFVQAIGSASPTDRAGQPPNFRSSIWRPASAGRLRINDGLPWWIFDKRRRVPGTRLSEYLRLARLLWAKADGRSAMSIECIGAALRAAGASAAARGAQYRAARRARRRSPRAVMRETLARGGQACRPLIARDGLGPTFIEPAIKHLRERNVEVRLAHELHAIRFAGDRIAALDFGDEIGDDRTR